MKVVQITPVIGLGAVGRIVESLYKGLAKSGHKCIVIAGRKGSTAIPSKDIILAGGKTARYTNALYARIFDRDGFYLLTNTKKIMSAIEEFHPDIIQMHGNYGYYMDVRELYRCVIRNNYPVVNTLHSCWDITGHCCYFTYSDCSKWKKCCCDCPQKKSYPASWICDNSKKNYIEKKKIFTSVKRQVIVTPSEWMAGIAKQSFLSKYPVKVIRNGINLAVFSKKNHKFDKYGIDTSKIIILGIARQWTERKGLSDFEELAKQINEKYQIIIIGLNRRQKRKMPSHVITFDKTENIYEMAALYSAASVLFNPTYEDNYPTVNLEAIACKTPVITYDTGGSPEIIRILGAGAVIKKKDYHSLLKWAAYYKIHPFHLEKEAAYRMLSDKMMVKKYLELYKTLAERAGTVN